MAPAMQEAIAAATAQLTRVVPVPNAIGYGVDLDCFDDVTAGLAELDPNSVRGITQDIYHRLTTPNDRTVVREDDPNYGLNIVGLLHQGVDAAHLANSEGAVAEQCELSDRVQRATVNITVSLGPPCTYTVSISIDPKDPTVGPFQFVIAVTDGASLLEATT